MYELLGNFSAYSLDFLGCSVKVNGYPYQLNSYEKKKHSTFADSGHYEHNLKKSLRIPWKQVVVHMYSLGRRQGHLETGYLFGRQKDLPPKFYESK